MHDDLNEDLLTLLALAVFADKRVFASEIEAFVTAATKLLNIEAASSDVFEQAAFNWFEQNRGFIQTKLTSQGFEQWFLGLLDGLQGIENKAEILGYLREISEADQDVHVSEKALVVLAAKRWSVSPLAAS